MIFDHSPLLATSTQLRHYLSQDGEGDYASKSSAAVYDFRNQNTSCVSNNSNDPTQQSRKTEPNTRVVITWHVICRVRARYFPFGLSLIIVKGAPYSEKEVK